MRTFLMGMLATMTVFMQPGVAGAQQPAMTLLPQDAPVQVRQAEAEALSVMDDFMRTFNKRDTEAFADTLTYPHVRIASGGVTVFPDRQSFIDGTDFAAFAKRFNWSHSQWDSIETVQADAEKVHFAVQFTRFNPQGEPYISFNSLYIVQRTDIGWGIRARSSFAP